MSIAIEPAGLSETQRQIVDLARDLILMGGYLLSGLNEPLVMTGALNKGTGRRFAETMSWAMDIYAPDGMERFGIGFKSALRDDQFRQPVFLGLQSDKRSKDVVRE